MSAPSFSFHFTFLSGGRECGEPACCARHSTSSGRTATSLWRTLTPSRDDCAITSTNAYRRPAECQGSARPGSGQNDNRALDQARRLAGGRHLGSGGPLSQQRPRQVSGVVRYHVGSGVSEVVQVSVRQDTLNLIKEAEA